MLACLKHDLNHICVHGLCRGADWKAQACSQKEGQHQREGKRIFSIPFKYISSIEQSSQSGLTHHIFLSLCMCELENAVSQSSKTTAVSSWKQMTLTNISQWSTSCWLWWMLFKSCCHGCLSSFSLSFFSSLFLFSLFFSLSFFLSVGLGVFHG